MYSESVRKVQLNRLRQKVGELVESFAKSQLELEEIKRENKALKELVKVQEKQLETFQNQQEISKIVSLVTDGNEEKEELKTKIDTYINEIEHCINFLNKAL